MATKTRKTRFVIVSDTHNGTPNGSFRLPVGDVLIHAGDLTNQGSFKEIQKAVAWLEEADFESKIVIAGNHDITLDTAFYNQYGLYFHNQQVQDPFKCQRLLAESKSILYLKNEAATVHLQKEGGPRTTFKVFGSPYSPAKGMWAFGYSSEEAPRIWENIPLDADVVVTHTPPKRHLDERSDRRAAGCEALRNALWRVRPRLAVCGHIHESRGAEIIQWDLSMSNVRYKEVGVETWADPGLNSKKQSLLDLTTESKRVLLNDGAIGDEVIPLGGQYPAPMVPRHPSMDITFTRNDFIHPDPLVADETEQPVVVKPSVRMALSRVTAELMALPLLVKHDSRGQGGVPPSPRCDIEALSGRMDRKETCVVNAAMMATSWPHKGTNGKRFNKPIVVDLDLPVLEDEGQGELEFL